MTTAEKIAHLFATCHAAARFTIRTKP
jgi:hypothetical protein